MIGQRFGNYRALSLLGEGGMGAVYLAEHPEIGRKVAVKVLRPELAKDQQLLQRFLNEARATNAIRHPNIIEILDMGVTADHVPYLVMELLEGETLSSRINRLGRLPVQDALAVGYQIASAVGAAHERSIIHRDLKPDNLFIVPDAVDPGREMIKVLDFGIAKLQATTMAVAVPTQTGSLLGTPLYMSPEQCRGTREIDHRSDIYSLGVILFEALCGRPPFVSEGFGELINMQLNEPPPSLRSLVPEIPEPVEKIVNTLLAKKPEDRFKSMVDLREAIRVVAGPTLDGRFSQALLSKVRGSGKTLAAISPGSSGAAAPPARGKTIRGAMAAVAILLLIMAVVAVSGRKPAAPRQAANTPAAPAVAIPVPPLRAPTINVMPVSEPKGLKIAAQLKKVPAPARRVAAAKRPTDDIRSER